MLLVIDYAAARGFPLTVRFAALVHDLGKSSTPPAQWPSHIGHEARGVELIQRVCERLRAPNDCRELALLAARHHGEIHLSEELKPSTIVKLLEKTDAFRRPDRFELLLDVCASDFHGRPGFEARPYAPAPRLRKALEAARAVDTAAIAHEQVDPKKIAAAVHQARVHAVKRAPSA
jgi:tRNA nucleotidyltransferase (CCA-adding enzyme)